MLVQAVPNFSEGRDAETLAALAGAARSAPGAVLADHSADADHHRCVLTLVGRPEAVLEAALAAARVAVARIDLTRHRGVHPRMGALDVLPFVPLGDTPMADCVDLAREAGRRLGEMGVPVYLYGEAAARPERRNLPDIRRGGFEALAAGPLVGARAPDFGPAAVHATAGAAAVGARGPLTAFNVVLATDDLAIARAVAARVREAGGGLPGVRALGLPLASTGRVQVSMNLTRPDLVSPADARERVAREAGALGVAVAESEIIGTLRLEEVLAAVRHYLAAPTLRRRQVLDLWGAALDPASVLEEPDAPE